MQTLLSAPQGAFTLHRYPRLANDTLRAWDAADEYLLSHLDLNWPLLFSDKPAKEIRVLIINDQFGALSCALHHCDITSLNDSYIATLSLQGNLNQNNLAPVPIHDGLKPLTGVYDLVVIKVQKSLAQLEDLLHKLRPHLNAQSTIVGAAMVKLIHRSTLSLFDQILGTTTTSLAKKKARLIFCQFEEDKQPPNNPYPSSFYLEQQQWQIYSHANVFSQGKLDIGCRFFIEHLPHSNDQQTIIDLGCGNGVVGLTAAKLNPKATVEFYDESAMAIASAQLNYQNIYADPANARFVIDDCLSQRAPNSADIILNNPPFHQQNVVGDAIAWRMFKQSHKTLRPNGELWVIGNRHLDYPQKLKKLFGNCKTVANNKKFVILKALKQR